MLQLLALGAVIGVMWGASRSGGRQQAEADLEQQGGGEQHQQQQSNQRLPAPLLDNSAQHTTAHGSRLGNAKIAAAAVGGLACLAAAAAVSILVGKQRRNGRSKQLGARCAQLCRTTAQLLWGADASIKNLDASAVMLTAGRLWAASTCRSRLRAVLTNRTFPVTATSEVAAAAH